MGDTTKIDEIAYYQGISDWWHWKKKCPVYWRGKAEEQAWTDGFNYARGWNRGS